MARFHTSEDTAEHFGIGLSFLQRLRASKKGPFYRRLGHRTVLYDWDEFEKWLETQPGGGQRIPAFSPVRTPRQGIDRG